MRLNNGYLPIALKENTMDFDALMAQARANEEQVKKVCFYFLLSITPPSLLLMLTIGYLWKIVNLYPGALLF